MDQIATRISELSPSLTLSINTQAKKMKDEGKDVCGFAAGEPDFDTPDFIKMAAAKALENGETKYTAAAGLLDLREALTEKLWADNKIEYTPHDIVVNCGAKHSCYQAISAICDEGDEVIIPSPYWTSYPEMARIAGATPVIVPTEQKHGWKMTPEQFEGAMTPRTKMVIINTPGNPTGAMYSREELEKLGEVALSEDIIILSDEIYEKMIYGEETAHVSIASLSDELRELTITINGFSKAYSMTGWRIGYAAAPTPIAKAMATIQSHTTSAPTTFAQWGAVAALQTDPNFINDMRDEFDMRRQYMLQRIRSINNVSTIEPLGAFYFLVNISQMGIKSVNFAEKLLSRHEVAVVPGIAFGEDETIRFSYATGLDVIKNGMDRFEDFCYSH